MTSKNPRIGFIGFGEVAYHFSKGLKEDGIQEIFAYDKNAKEKMKGEIVRQRAREAGVELVQVFGSSWQSSDVVFSAVWGNEALKVAGRSASFMKTGQIYCDIKQHRPLRESQERKC